MKKIIINLIISMASLFIVSNLVDSMYIGSFSSLLVLSIVLGVLNVTVKPLIKLFSLPINVLTLGLFSLVINAIILKIGFMVVPDIALYGFMNAILISILLSICNTILNMIFN